jgi:hypothetical protein
LSNKQGDVDVHRCIIEQRKTVQVMALTREDAVRNARADLAKRVGVSEAEIKEVSVDEADFPDMALGAPVGGEMSGMMMSSGWRITLSAKGKPYEYRADRNQLRLHGFKGKNYRI